MTAAERARLDGGSDTTFGGSLVCSLCGYGVARHAPPGRCPMCGEDDAWVEPASPPADRSIHRLPASP